MAYDAGTSKRTIPIIIKILTPQSHEIPTSSRNKSLKERKKVEIFHHGRPLMFHLDTTYHVVGEKHGTPIIICLEHQSKQAQKGGWSIHGKAGESRKLPEQPRHRSISLKVLAL